MRGRAGALVQAILLGAIVLLGMGYMQLNTGLDNAYAACREANDVEACTCWRDGFAEGRSVFTEAPVLGRLFRRDQASFEKHMAEVRSRCGMTA